MTIAADLRRKATKQTNKINNDLDPNMVFLKEFEKVDFEKIQQVTKKNMKNYPVGKKVTFCCCILETLVANSVDPDCTD